MKTVFAKECLGSCLILVATPFSSLRRLLDRSFRGKHMRGTLKKMAVPPNARNPSHQAPIHLGSFGVISTAVIDQRAEGTAVAFVKGAN